MTPTLSVSSALDSDAIKHLAGLEGPSVSIFLPATRPGSAEASHAALVRAALREFPDLLHSVEDLTEFGSGGGGLAIFGSREIQERYKAPWIRTPLVVMANRFHLIPVLAAGSAPRELYVLDLNRKQLRFLHVLDGECRTAPLPPGVPSNMEAAGDFAQHSHDLANRSRSGSGQTVHFGKETERDAGGEYLHHFFAQVDRNLAPALGGKPLILAGVREETSAYRRLARYPAIFASEIHKNTAFLSLDELESCVMMAVMAEHRAAGERVMAKIGEMKDRSRQMTGVREVCLAAAQGRVHQLCIAEGAEAMGAVPGTKPSWASEDLLNAAAVFTIRSGGSVYVLPADGMKDTGPVGAILRY